MATTIYTIDQLSGGQHKTTQQAHASLEKKKVKHEDA